MDSNLLLKNLNINMDIQLKLRGVVKISFYFSYQMDILRDNRFKFVTQEFKHKYGHPTQTRGRCKNKFLFWLSNGHLRDNRLKFVRYNIAL